MRTSRGRCLVALWLALALTACSRTARTNVAATGDETAAVTAALAEIPIDSLCENVCLIVLVDTLVRYFRSGNESAILAGDSVLALSWEQVRAALRTRLKVLPSAFTARGTVRDTALVAVLLRRDSATASSRVVRAIVDAPDFAGALVTVTLLRDGNIWRPSRRELAQP